MSSLEEFFQLPLDAKLRIHRHPGSFWGYTVAHLDRTSSKLPWREMRSLGNNSVASENGIVDYFKSVSGKDFEPMGWVYDRYFREVKELSLKILELLAIGLGSDREYFQEFFKYGELNMRCISYPPCQKPEEVLGIGPHCDPSALTVLQQDQVEGFEVFVEGKWQRISPRPEALVINIGEIFMVVSTCPNVIGSVSFMRITVKWCDLEAAMRTRTRVSATDIRTHAAKKKAVTEVGSSRPPKKSRITTPSVPTRETNIPSEIVLKPVLALSVPTMLLPTEAPSAEVGMARDDGAVVELSAAPSVGV
uniref:Gibberellin 20 oxidase 2-like n=1 Tax=Elaeis guineensis var. tenera TaxID=51953 RepID=A0A8N4I9Z7_ELAGV|nr:gibberellin 20 oxidase 2-like [Elaeis guineensis]